MSDIPDPAMSVNPTMGVCFMADAGIVKGERVAIVHFIDSTGARLVRMADLLLLPRWPWSDHP